MRSKSNARNAIQSIAEQIGADQIRPDQTAPRDPREGGAKASETKTGEGGKRQRADRGKILHTRNRHLGNHHGFSVAFSNGCSLFSGTVQRIVTFSVDFYWNTSNRLSIAFSNGS